MKLKLLPQMRYTDETIGYFNDSFHFSVFFFSGVAQPQRYSDTCTDSFDTVITFVAFAESSEAFAKTSAYVHTLYQYLYKLYDRYNFYEDEETINVYSLNKIAAEEPVKVDA